VTFLGIDLAASPKGTFACVLEPRDGTLVARLHRHCDDDDLRALADGRDKIAIDAPFGWPAEFVRALEAHRRLEAWPAPEGGDPGVFRATLSFRATDRVVMQTKRPLSVSTDKLGVTAMRCAHLLHRWSVAGEPVDRTGGGRFVEVYPAGALVRWGLPGGGYKGNDREPLRALLDRVRAELPALELTPGDQELCAGSDDAFDALVSALVACAAARGLTEAPSAEERALAAEEGWIHLPLWGSLRLLAPAGRGLGEARPAQALAERLRTARSGVSERGYAQRVEDVLLDAFDEEVGDAIRSALTGKGGSELRPRGDAPPKFLAAHSSACLAANVFGPWLTSARPVPMPGETYEGRLDLEVECRTGLRGTPPTLDVVVEGGQVLAVESKCTETFQAHGAEFAHPYGPLVHEVAGRRWQEEYARLIQDPGRYRLLDAAQLVKHHLGLRRTYSGRPVTLAYLYWEPTNASEIPECAVHRAEVARFTQGVEGDRHMRFVALSYGELWDAWEALDEPWLRRHVEELRRRYDVSL